MARNKYAEVEGLLYSYASFPYRKKNCEIDLQLTTDKDRRDKIGAELEKIELLTIKVENMLDMLKKDNEIDYLIIKLKYIDKLTWVQIELQLNKSISSLILRRNAIMKDKLMSCVEFGKQI